MSSGAEGTKRQLSVIREVHVLASSVESLRELAHRKLSGWYHGENITELAVIMAGALHVLRDRIRLLEEILSGTADPAQLLCPSNEADSSKREPYLVAVWAPEEYVRRTMLALQADCYRKAQERLLTMKVDDKGRSN